MVFYSRHNWEIELPNIKALGKEGKSMADIAKIYNLSRQRIKQIVDKEIPDWAENYGKRVLQQQKTKQYLSRWGTRLSTELYQIQRTKYRNKKYSVSRLGIEWNVPFGELIWPTHCPILGLELNYFAEKTEEASPSFDRINSTKGYVTGNVQIISWRANRIKNDGTALEHQKIYEYLDKLSKANS